MENFNQFYTYLILVPGTTFVVAVAIKALTERIKNGRWIASRALGSGGMPSVHSAVVTSLAASVALKYGLVSDLFAICITLTFIIIYDAINVRFEAGLHAEAINEAIGQKKFKESLGHLPSEAFAGSILGILVALGLYYI